MKADPISYSKVETLKSTRDFELLEREWNDLYEKSPLAIPFQSWAWLYSWWETYGADFDLRLISVRNEELLLGVAPFMLDRRGAITRLSFVGTGLTDCQDVLIREGWEDEVAERVAQTIAQMDSWQVVDLQQVRSEAAVWRVFWHWGRMKTYLFQDGRLILKAESWEQTLSSLSKNLRKTVRRSLQRAQDDGMYAEISQPTESKRAARRLVALHREGWQGKNISVEHLEDRFEMFVANAVDRMTLRGLCGISEFWRNDEVVLSSWWICRRGFVGTYMVGVSQEALQRYQWSSLYIWDALNVASNNAASCLDLLRGEEPYKLRWTSEISSNYRLIMGRSRVIWSVYACYFGLYSKAKQYAKDDNAPKWVKKAAEFYRARKGS